MIQINSMTHACPWCTINSWWRPQRTIDDDEQRWDAALNDPNSSRMRKLVDQALEDIREGRTEPLDSYENQ